MQPQVAQVGGAMPVAQGVAAPMYNVSAAPPGYHQGP